jgi:curli biogenesis system outer membrane secretion channel CsgG
MNCRHLLTFAAATALAFSASLADARQPKAADAKGKAKAAESAPAASCVGPRKRVAVLKFGGTGKYGAYEGWDVGEAIAAQLSTALEQTSCFVVIDRLALSEVLREQELGLAGVVGRDTAARAGGLIGAQILIKGEITEFEPGKKGKGATAGVGLSNVPIGLRVGGNHNVAHVAIDVRLIDASTGQVLFTQSVTSEARTFGLALGIDYRKASIGGDSFEKTPLGEAMREAVGEATGYIVTQMRQVNWTGQVVDVQGSTVYLNAGEGAGIKVGDTLSIYTVTRELIDPATGQSLGREEKKLGELRVGRVDQKYAVGELVGEFQTRRGDLIKM